MDATELSEALVLWTGRGQHAWPHRDEASVVDAFGEERALDLLSRIKTLEEEFYESDARVTASDLREMGDRAAAEFRARHPELSEDAVEALAWCYTFDFK